MVSEMAGHSKWANIQHRKGRQDALRSKLFSKFAKEITVAAKLGDPDPEKNPRLRLAVKEAKSNSVPKDVIERAIKKSQSGDSESYHEIRYEGYGLSGVAFIVETMTDNKNRTASNVRSIFNKFGGNLGETGSVSFLFDRVGFVSFPSDVCDAEKFFEVALEAGAEDVDNSDEEHLIYCSDVELTNVSGALESIFGESTSTKLIWKPKNLIEISFESAEKILNLIYALEEDEDVQAVTTNFSVNKETLQLFKN